MKKLKCGVIGAGRVGQMHIENLQTIREVEVVCVADLFIEDARENLNTLGITELYQDYHEVLANQEIEAVFIFTSTDTHEEIAIAAAQAGKHIFCEKPLSMDLAEEASLRVLRAVKNHEVKMQIGFNRRIDRQAAACEDHFTRSGPFAA